MVYSNLKEKHEIILWYSGSFLVVFLPVLCCSLDFSPLSIYLEQHDLEEENHQWFGKNVIGKVKKHVKIFEIWKYLIQQISLFFIRYFCFSEILLLDLNFSENIELIWIITAETRNLKFSSYSSKISLLNSLFSFPHSFLASHIKY